MHIIVAIATYPLRVLWSIAQSLLGLASPVEVSLHYVSGQQPAWMQPVLLKSPWLLEGFKVSPWAPDGHFQSICTAALSHFVSPVTYEREKLEMPDQELVALDWVAGQASLPRSAPICLILHGFSGNSEDLKIAAHEAAKSGMRAVAINKRGHAAGLDLLRPKLLSFGDSSDLRYIITVIKARYPDSAIVAVGFSAGSGLLASYVQDFPVDSLLDGMVCVSPGYDTHRLFCVNNGEVPQPYHQILLKGQKRILEKNCRVLADCVNMSAMRRCRTLNEFTTIVELPMYNLTSLEEYWRINNPMRSNFGKADVPTLCINSADDPVIPKSMIPFEKFEREWSSAALLLTSGGGHCGFLEGWRGRHWDCRAACAFLRTVAERLPK